MRRVSVEASLKCREPRRSKVFISIIILTIALIAQFLGAAAFAEGPQALDLSAYKGRVVYLDFWASWCGPCAQSFPYMAELKRLYAEQGLEIIAVNVDHSRERADAFLTKTHSHLNVVYDPKGQLATAFGVKDMPTAVLIGRDGRTRYVHEGFFPEKEPLYHTHISELLNEK